MVFLEGTQSFLSDLKLLKFVVRRGTKSNVEEDRQGTNVRIKEFKTRSGKYYRQLYQEADRLNK